MAFPQPSASIVPAASPSPSPLPVSAAGHEAPPSPVSMTRSLSVPAAAVLPPTGAPRSLLHHSHSLPSISPPKAPVPDWMFEDEYQEDAINHMLELEAATAPQVAMIDTQPHIGWSMRRFLIDFLIEVHTSYSMGSESVLYQAVNVADRYMSKRVVLRTHYQLMACCALLIASKYDNAKAPRPSLQRCREMCQGTFDDKSFIQMSQHILSTLGWSLGQPTVSDWIAFKCSALQEPAQVEWVAHYLAQLSLYHRAFVGLSSAHLAAAVHPLARVICGIEDPQCQVGSATTGVATAAYDLLDRLVSDPLNDTSPLLTQKFASPQRAMAAILVRQYAVERHLRSVLRHPSLADDDGCVSLSSPAPSVAGSAMAPTCSRQSSISTLSITSSGSSMPATPGSADVPTRGLPIIAPAHHPVSWGAPVLSGAPARADTAGFKAAIQPQATAQAQKPAQTEFQTQHPGSYRFILSGPSVLPASYQPAI